MPGQLVTTIWQSQPHIHAPVKHRRACQYQAFIPDALGGVELALPVEVVGMVSEAEAAVRGLNDRAQPALVPLARLLLRTESIASSKVEGLQMGVRELARAEARMETGGKKSPTAVEIVANIDAMETAVNEAATSERFGEEQLLRIHRRLMEHDPRPQVAGRFRMGQNWIGGNDYTPCGADYVPPPVEEVTRLLDDLYTVMNDDLLPPLVQAALVHAQFETIHPFDDGNGRTGRALIHVILRRRGVAPDYVPPISVILANSRERYIAGLERFRGDGTVEWIEHFASVTTHAANLAAEYVNRVESLMENWREQLRATIHPRADAAAWAVINVLPAYPVITSPVAAATTGRSKGPIHDALAQLVEAGVLIPLSASRRNQGWEAVGMLDLLEELEAGGENDKMG
jgi:Fic family protein